MNVAVNLIKEMQLNTTTNELETQLYLFEEIIDKSSDAIVAFGKDKKIIIWNSGAEKLLGYSRAEAIGKTPQGLQYIKISSLEIEKVEKQIIEQNDYKSERNLYHKNGTVMFASVTGNYIANKDGDFKIFYFIFRDISFRKRLEDSLKIVNDDLERLVKFRTDELIETERYYRYLFEHNPMPMWVIANDNFRFLDVNNTAVEQYGYSRNEFLSMTSLEIRPKQDRDAFLSLYRDNNLKTELKNRGVWKHIKKDGTNIYVEISAQNIIFNGIAAKLILANNITEKKLAEEKLAASEKRFKSLIENSNDLFTMFDESFNIIYRSQSAERVTGWTREEMMYENGTKNIHPDDLEYALNIIKDIKANPGKNVKLHFRNKHKNGHYIHVEGNIVNLLNDDQVNAIVINFHDVSEARNAEIEKEKMVSEIIKRSKSLEQFAYIVSHNLRLPVANILGVTHLLNSKTDEEEKADLIKYLNDSTNQLDGVIKDLNNTLQIQSNINERKQIISLSNTIKDIKLSIQNIHLSENISLNFDFKELDEIISIKSYIYSILFNLVSNSIKYKKTNENLEVFISSKATNGFVRISVKDNGQGIDLNKNKDKIFGLYKRFHPKIEGKGLGLFMVKTQVETLGGSIDVISELNKGTEFIIELPL